MGSKKPKKPLKDYELEYIKEIANMAVKIGGNGRMPVYLSRTLDTLEVVTEERDRYREALEEIASEPNDLDPTASGFREDARLALEGGND